MPSPSASKLPSATKALRFAKNAQAKRAAPKPPSPTTRASKARVTVHEELMTPLPSTIDHSAALAAPRRAKATHNGNKNIHGVKLSDLGVKKLDTTPKAKMPATQAGGDRTALSTTTIAGAEQVDPNKPLTEKQKLFVRYWAAGESIAAASARAGYSDNATFAYRLVRMPNVLKLYEEEKQLYREASLLDKAKITDMFLQAFDIAKLEADPHAMVSATRELGKIIGVYAPVEKKVTLTVEGEVKIKQMNSMSTEELSRLVYGSENAAAEALGNAVEQALEEDDDE